MPELTVEEMHTDELTPYARNAKIHTSEQVDQIAKSIEEFGFNDPIGVWDNPDGGLEIVEGHGRVLAAKKIGLEYVPVIRLDHLSDEQRRAYTHIHNQLTLNSDFDYNTLLDDINDLPEFDFGEYGFGVLDDGDLPSEIDDGTYSTEVKSPVYEPQGRDVSIPDLVDTEKMDGIVSRVEQSDAPDDVKEFLKLAATRHAVFNYRNIAEYYAQADSEVKKLFEDSVLIIIDYDQAIEKGLVKLYDAAERVFEDAEEG